MNQPATKRGKSGRIAVFNIDGCISDDRWRRSRVPEGASQPADFTAYHDAAENDPPLAYGAAILANHIANGDFIVFATGRDMTRDQSTSNWLVKHFNIKPDEDFIILMRAANDHRAVVDVKAGFVQYLKSFAIEKGKTVVAAYDNRRDVVDMYRALGFEATILNEDGEFVPTGADAGQSAITNGAYSPPQGNAAVEPVGTRDAQSHFDRAAFADRCKELNGQFDSLGTKPPEFIAHPTGNIGSWEDERAPVAHNHIVEPTNAQKYPQYFKDISGLDELDVYLLLELFPVKSHAIGHAIKKLLLPGVRTGGKSTVDDVREARDTLNRWLQIQEQWARRNPEALPG